METNGRNELGSAIAGDTAAQRRKEHDLPDRPSARQQHHETIDSEPEATGRRHAVFQGLHEVLVVRLRLLVARLQQTLLLLEASTLLVGVVQLGERVRDLDAADEPFETLNQPLLAPVRLRKWRQLFRIVEDEGRLDQVRLD